ncbi:MAG: histidine phosphatase family protein [Inquilinus sp.]|nr:histidine phosphatase family protein [Inquilinus sp.]
MQTIYVIRHGETEWNRAGRMQGGLDSPLTARGEDQARRVGALLGSLVEDLGAARLLASPLGRTRHTAALIADALGVAPDRFESDPEVVEIGWGAWEGMTHLEIADAAPEEWVHFRADRWHRAPPGGESYAAMSERARRWLDKVTGEPVVVLISHGAFGRALRGRYAGLSPAETLAQKAPNDTLWRLSQGTVGRFDAA